ncbi:MAG: hypothetical protein LBH09_08630 [Peptococcaceae bacterium]|nr:hypothetical protein [Peptococcaceae bacterium]
MLVGKTFVDPLETPFSRRGSYLCFANRNGGSNLFGKAQLWLCTSRQRPNDKNKGSLIQSNHFRQTRLELVKDGIPRQCVISTTPYEVVLECDFGSVRFCIGDMKYVRCRGTDGLTLRITPVYGGIQGPLLIDLLDGSWKTFFGNYFMLYVPTTGTLKKGPTGSMELSPDANGVIEMVFEESLLDPKRRDSYLGYDACLGLVKEDFDSFASSVAPTFPEKYQETGMKALWTLWSLTNIPDGESAYKRQMIKMIRVTFEAAFSWQLPMHAIWLSHNLTLAWELLLACFDNQDANGRIADALTYAGPGETMKPPVQGLALLWLMEHKDLSQFPVEDKEFLYDRMIKWTNFHYEFRDLDKDGIVENHTAGETGWESGSYMQLGFPMALPDTNAYLALMMEAIGKLGRMIGKEDKECAYWENRSKENIQKIIDKCWTENGWTAVNLAGEKWPPVNMAPFCALVLGKRLPQTIIDRSIEIICKEPFDTPYGLGSERLDSPWFRHGWCQGSIATPMQFLMSLAFESCDRHDLAEKVAHKYMDTLINHGLYHIHNPFSGSVEYGENGRKFYEEENLFFSGWTAGCYIYLAEHYGA